MAPKAINVSAILVIVLIILSANAAMAQSDCTNVLISMASCLNYVTGSSNTPSPSCCSALGNVVQTQPRCLCTIVNGGGGSLGVNINRTQALALPGACKVETPPISRCNESSPPESGDGSDDSPTNPSVTGSKTDAASNGSISKICPQLVAFFLFVIALHSLTFIGY
ncbi:non-specific lipid-transfer protein-like protein At2g13820 isoform X2 [Olea europaea var. sylvestris]|uniref:Non-specific lipid-transfer At2g13820 n=1 Tax=Olea europaea subsp. europaea TaxID=158383 RepID=A0A8S0T8L2_OLEEU|nr:non-specific lipid-transfer protein-like protein At2g13820 isoform X2 [Olea europaea var. sylvestris]CAA3001305.1 non-specific lipid-transfer At2g13820 [Olea europaea subsp. europaea]